MSGGDDSRPAAVGVVLAGGASRRMGSDKATLVVDGASLAERAARRLAEVVTEVVVADRGRGLVAGLPSLADGPGEGPAAGILGAHRYRPGRALLVLACDLPQVPAALLGELARLPGDWALPRWRRGLEPLAACYRAAALEAVERRVAAGVYDLRGLAREGALAIRLLEGPALERHGRPEEVFLNLNRPRDLGRLGARGAGDLLA